MTKGNFMEGLSKKTDKLNIYSECDLALTCALARLVRAGFSEEEVDFIVGQARALASSKRPVGSSNKEEKK